MSGIKEDGEIIYSDCYSVIGVREEKIERESIIVIIDTITFSHIYSMIVI